MYSKLPNVSHHESFTGLFAIIFLKKQVDENNKNVHIVYYNDSARHGISS